MGWKASCLLALEHPNQPVTDFRLDARRASAALTTLGRQDWSAGLATTFEESMNPKGFVLGAYPGGLLLADPELAAACEKIDQVPWVGQLAGKYPWLAVVVLHSVVNLHAHWVFVDGRPVRAYAGSSDAGLVLERGQPLPEEAPHFQASRVRDGTRFFVSQGEEYPPDQYGEILAFAVTARFFGRPLDEAELEAPMIAYLKPRAKPFWKFW